MIRFVAGSVNQLLDWSSVLPVSLRFAAKARGRSISQSFYMVLAFNIRLCAR
jgi:hypothetical protein